jgi:hypothetical protein
MEMLRGGGGSTSRVSSSTSRDSSTSTRTSSSTSISTSTTNFAPGLMGSERSGGASGSRFGARTHAFAKPLVVAAFAGDERGSVGRLREALAQALLREVGAEGEEKAEAMADERLPDDGGGAERATPAHTATSPHTAPPAPPVSKGSTSGGGMLLVDGRAFGREADVPLASALAQWLTAMGSYGSVTPAFEPQTPQQQRQAQQQQRHAKEQQRQAHAEQGEAHKPPQQPTQPQPHGQRRQALVVLDHFERIATAHIEPLIHALGEGGLLYRTSGAHETWLGWLRGPLGSMRRSVVDATVPSEWLLPLGEAVSVVDSMFVLLIHLPRDTPAMERNGLSTTGEGASSRRQAPWCTSSPADADAGQHGGDAEDEFGAESAGAAGGPLGSSGGDGEEALRMEVADMLRCRDRTHHGLPEVIARRIDHLIELR